MWNSGIKTQIVLVIPKSLCLKHLVPWWVEMGNVTVRTLTGSNQNIQKGVAGTVTHQLPATCI